MKVKRKNLKWLVRKWSLTSIALVVELEAFDIVNRRNFHFVMPSFNSANFFFIGNLNCDGALHIKMISFLLWKVFKIMFLWTLQRQYCLKTGLIQLIAFLESENSLQNYITSWEALNNSFRRVPVSRWNICIFKVRLSHRIVIWIAPSSTF